MDSFDQLWKKTQIGSIINKDSVVKLMSTLLLCICIICFTSCHSKSTPIEDLANLAEDVKANYENYTEQDWESFVEELEFIEQELAEYQDQYTDEEIKEIGRMEGICLGYATKYCVKSIKKDLNSVVKGAEGFLEGFSDAFGDGIYE